LQYCTMKNSYPPFEESLLLKYLLGQTGEEERRQIEEWLFSEKGNRQYLDQLEKVWVEAGRITPAPIVVDIDAAWQRMLGRISGMEVQSQTRSLRYVWTAAAVLLVSFGIWFALRFYLAPPKMMEFASATQIIKDTLPDGTKVSLNKNTRLSFPEKFAAKKREVKLTGEARFEVRHDAGSPFVVEAGKAQVRVLGTVFSVKAYSGTDVEVDVEQGLVMLFTVDPTTHDTLSLLLQAGNSGVLPAGSMQPVMKDGISADHLFWLDRTLEFRQTELSEVFRVLSGHFGIGITASDPAILKCRLTATFRDESLPTILEVIATSFELGLKNEGTNWRFYGKGCSE